jgi:hypothetical protein
MGLWKVPFGLVALLVLLEPLVHAAGDVMIHPTRIVFEKNQRSAKVDLTNTGSEVAAFRISIENKRMTPTGEFVAVKTPLPGEFFADKMIQFSPRQIELAPGSGQTIRILLRKPADLASGEYRSQLVFTRLPTASMNSVESGNLSGNEIGVHLTALIGVSIPIIVQNGETSASATLSELKLNAASENEPAQIAFKINRSGNRSLYGDLTIKYADKGGGEQVVAEAKGIAVYSPNPFRVVKMNLHPQGGQAFQKGKLSVSFNEIHDAGGRPLAQGALELPQ